MKYCSICGVGCKDIYELKVYTKQHIVCGDCFTKTKGKSMKELSKLIRKSSL